MYVDAWRMLEYVKSEKTLRIIASLESIAAISREFGIIFDGDKPKKTKIVEEKKPEISNNSKSWLERKFFK